jgi:hypothetical protein
MDPEKESCGISFTSTEKNQKIAQVSLCFVVGLIAVDYLSYNLQLVQTKGVLNEKETF